MCKQQVTEYKTDRISQDVVVALEHIILSFLLAPWLMILKPVLEFFRGA